MASDVSLTFLQQPEDEDDFVLDKATACTLLMENLVLISENIDLDSSLMAYLIQYSCIGLEDINLLRCPKSLDSNLRLTEIIAQRGGSGFNSFLKALEAFTAANPEESAHIEVLHTLKCAVRRYMRRQASELLLCSSRQCRMNLIIIYTITFLRGNLCC